MKKILISILLVISLIPAFSQKRLKEQPSDVLNAPVGLLITVPIHYDYQEVKSYLTDKLTSMGYKIHSVHRWDYFSFNADKIKDDFSKKNIKYVLQFCEVSEFKMLTVHNYVNNATLQDKSKDYTHLQAMKLEGLFNDVEKSLKKVSPATGAYDKKTALANNDEVYKLIGEYPKDLDTTNLLIIKYVGMGAEKIQKETVDIFQAYPYKKMFVPFDSVQVYKNKGQRYLLSLENYPEYFYKTTFYSGGDIDTDTKKVFKYFPVIRDLQSGNSYYRPDINSYAYPGVYKKFVEEVKK